MHKSENYPVVEHFYSLQGEGFWTGTPMYFFRLAQCPVGKVPGICRSWDGRSFICDTGESYAGSKAEWHPYTKVRYHMSSVEMWDLVRKAGCKRMLLTGGEPLIYDVRPLVFMADKSRNETVHVETSGTVSYDPSLSMWVTVSPKEEYKDDAVRWANELKVLVDQDVNETELLRRFVILGKRTYVQPIEDTKDREQTLRNMGRAIDLCLKHPEQLRLSLQTHKYLEIR